MRVIRTIDPLSGKTMQRKITLSSTSGVNVTQHEELQKSTISDVTVASNQLTRAVYDVRDTMRETNVINYEISKKLKKGIDNIASANTDIGEAVNMGYQTNVDALNNIREEIQDFKNTERVTTIEATQSITNGLTDASLQIDASSNVIKDALNTMANSANSVLDELSSHDISSADELTVIVNGEKKTVNETFTEVFRLLSVVITKLNDLVNDYDQNSQDDNSNDEVNPDGE